MDFIMTGEKDNAKLNEHNEPDVENNCSNENCLGVVLKQGRGLLSGSDRIRSKVYQMPKPLQNG